MAKRLKIDSGDVFAFPAGEKFAAGQVLISNISLYIVIFEPLFAIEDIANINPNSTNILLAGWTDDALIYHGDWIIMGNKPVVQPFDFPVFKMNHNGILWLVDVNGKPIRHASRGEAESHEFQWSRSSKGFQDAFVNHHLGVRKPTHTRLFVA